ncbi:MAG: hypothetical protein A2096_10815 [Spirochaetes bacterium GWF1_41_5]|nr:MAG: hypothetical protein A2096_10815 [Spirochaetes bacterium GWF1_41_5]
MKRQSDNILKADDLDDTDLSGDSDLKALQDKSVLAINDAISRATGNKNIELSDLEAEALAISRQMSELENTKLHGILAGANITDENKRNQILANIKSSGQNRDFAEMKKLVKNFIDQENREKSGTAVISTPAATKSEQGVSKDAAFTITFSEDKMQALLAVNPPLGSGKPIALQTITAWCTAKKITGIKTDEIEKSLREMARSKKPVIGKIIAEGKPAEDGKNLEIKFEKEFTDAAAAGFSSQIAGQVCMVKDGDLLISASEPTKGKEGANIFGENIAPKPGSGEITAGDHIMTQKRGNNRLYYSRLTGLAQLDKNTLDVILYQDASFLITVSDDAMKAILSLNPGAGLGKKLVFEDIMQAIAEKKIICNVNENLIRNKTEEANNTSDPLQIDFIFAEGLQPEEGKDGEIEFFVKVKASGQHSEKHDGRIDYRQRENLVKVQKDDKIFSVIPPLPGSKNGQDIYGKIISMREVKSKELNIGKNIRTETDSDSGVLTGYAELEGSIKYDEKTGFIEVARIHEIDAINLQSGNIDFSGDIIVKNNIDDEMIVKLTGDLQVKGNIGSAMITADGNIICEGGIVTKHRGIIICRGNLSAKFIENSIIKCTGDVKVSKAILNSRVISQKAVIAEGEKGIIIGGEIKALNLIRAKSAGSSAGIKTTLQAGYDYISADKLALITEKRLQMEKRLQSTDELIQKLFKMKPSVDQFTEQMKNVYKESLLVQMKLKKKLLEIKMIETKLTAEIEKPVKAEIIIEDKLFNDTLIIIGNVKHTVSNTEDHVKYIRAEGSDRIEKKFLN